MSAYVFLQCKYNDIYTVIFGILAARAYKPHIGTADPMTADAKLHVYNAYNLCVWKQQSFWYGLTSCETCLLLFQKKNKRIYFFPWNWKFHILQSYLVQKRCFFRPSADPCKYRTNFVIFTLKVKLSLSTLSIWLKNGIIFNCAELFFKIQGGRV